MRKSKKPKLKSISNLNKRAWGYFSHYLRRSGANDHGQVKCYTCDSVHMWKDVHMGHFFHGHYKPTFLMPENVRIQCVACNMHKNGNLAIYAVRLLKEFNDAGLNGVDKLQELETESHRVFKPTREYYEDIITRYREAVKKFDAKP